MEMPNKACARMVVWNSNIDLEASKERIEQLRVVNDDTPSKGHFDISLPDSTTWIEISPKGKIVGWFEREEDVSRQEEKLKEVLVDRNNEPVRLQRAHTSLYKQPDVRLRSIAELQSILNTVNKEYVDFSVWGTHYIFYPLGEK